ncbi:CocE/NonD family hydrolase [Streptomyces sp. NPDC053560]|uniref:CocE/NonD family hydrolase n=1 Tax=Streptomyces sp. NPDC053560 TaxID=3365711 RepID=UPI0037D7C9AF
MALKVPRPRGRRLVALVAVLGVLLGGGSWAAVAASDDAAPAVHREDHVLTLPEKPGSKSTVRIDTSYFTSTADSGRRPAVLVGHGFGASKTAAAGQAQQLARAGYAVLTWSARGFGRSTGKIGLNDPKGEVADASGLIDWLAKRPEVQLDKAGDPRVGMTGASYGGAIALLTAAHDPRVDAIAPQITYWNLADALFPDGVFKKLWAGYFFTTGSAPVSTTVPNPARGVACNRFEAQLCRMYERVAVSGRPDDAARKMLESRSPKAFADRIKVPTLISQGQSDSLFPLGQSDALAKALKKNGAPVSVDWIEGGHDGGNREESRVLARTEAWFARYLKKDRGADTGPAFRISRAGGVNARDGASRLTGATGDSYPGLRGDPRSVPLAGREQTLTNPAGGDPPAISSVPGIGAALGSLSALGNSPSLDFPGQYARFESAPLKDSVQVTGSPTAKIRVRSDHDEAVLFAKVYDVGPDGQSQLLPHQLVTPLRVTDAKDGRTVSVRLPAIDHEFEAGHQMRLVVAATDMAYASPDEPAVYKVALAGKDALSVPTAPDVRTAPTSLPWWVWGMPLAAVLIAGALLLTGRRRTTPPAPDPGLAEVPLRITGLTKKYAGAVDRYAVRELTFGVERGQVLGLLGPNGAGKTTTLRMLMGLITPDEGEIRVFGHAVRPGAPVLSRVGAFVEGAGFLPHLTGRENLELYWRATGRPAEDAHLDEALEIAGLGEALQRAVRTYSQGMRQRLAIAQAMLGLPDLLILDEPTNGLDPPQIREMRAVMIRYAAEGRTVIVSSHLLAEVEQTCTHLVVMDRGRLVQAGPVAEIVGSGDTLLVGTAVPVPDGVVEKVAALPFVASVAGGDDGLLVRLDGTAGTTELLAELLRLDVPVESVGPHRRLEDAFLTLIGGDR